MKKVFIVALAVFLSACKSVPLDDNYPSKDAIRYTQEFGKVEVTYTDEGDWLEIKSTASANVVNSEDAALEQAMNVATMRAKRNIVEFMTTQLQSKKSLDSITDSLTKDGDEKEKNSKIAVQIVEKITEQSDGILRGVYVVDRKVSSDSKTVAVIVRVDKRSMRAANNIKRSMGM